MKLSIFLFVPLFLKKNNFYNHHTIKIEKTGENYLVEKVFLLNNTGADQRYTEDIKKEENELYNIKKAFYNTARLKKLTSNLTSREEKIELANDILDANSYGINILSGGLMNDWDFKI